MSKFAISRSLFHIVQCVDQKHYPTKKVLLDYLEDKDIKVAPRTIDRYFESIRSDLGLDITYSHTYRGYFINKEGSVKLSSFFKYLEILELATILSESLTDSSKITNYVHFEDSKDFKGVDNLKPILLAIKENRSISFVHNNYETNKNTEYTVTPLILKEYINRWYVVTAFNNKEIRTFGLDRISNIQVGDGSTIKREQFQDLLNKFQHTLGLTYGKGEPKEVVLKVEEIHVKYLKSLPLHSSQLIYPKDKDGRYKVSYKLYPNYEFLTAVLKMGPKAEVIEPVELREEIKNMLKSALKYYV